jgi:hypothetical protein
MILVSFFFGILLGTNIGLGVAYMLFVEKKKKTVKELRKNHSDYSTINNNQDHGSKTCPNYNSILSYNN